MDIGVEIHRSNLSVVSVLNPVARPSQAVPGATVSLQWNIPQQAGFSSDYYSVVGTEAPFDEGATCLGF
jgi:hypothetical protein